MSRFIYIIIFLFIAISKGFSQEEEPFMKVFRERFKLSETLIKNGWNFELYFKVNKLNDSIEIEDLKIRDDDAKRYSMESEIERIIKDSVWLKSLPYGNYGFYALFVGFVEYDCLKRNFKVDNLFTEFDINLKNYKTIINFEEDKSLDVQTFMENPKKIWDNEKRNYSSSENLFYDIETFDSVSTILQIRKNFYLLPFYDLYQIILKKDGTLILKVIFEVDDYYKFNSIKYKYKKIQNCEKIEALFEIFKYFPKIEPNVYRLSGMTLSVCQFLKRAILGIIIIQILML